jgi:hypothetical protein
MKGVGDEFARRVVLALPKLVLNRGESTDQGTSGVLSEEIWQIEEGKRKFSLNPVCVTLELPDRNNELNFSSIPKGEYDVILMADERNFAVKNFRGKTVSHIHAGNWAGDRKKKFCSDSKGGILPGVRIGELTPNGRGKGQMAVIDSLGAMQKLLISYPNGFRLIIK